MEQSFMDHLDAWRDFHDSFLPLIWGGLSRNERRTLNTAEADYWGKRKDRKGNVIKLGADRVEGLLERFAPGRYGVERVVRFWVKPPPAPP